MGKWKRIIRNVIAWPILGCPVAATAGYSLHREVKNPTPALKRAAQIGALRLGHDVYELLENAEGAA